MEPSTQQRQKERQTEQKPYEKPTLEKREELTRITEGVAIPAAPLPVVSE